MTEDLTLIPDTQSPIDVSRAPFEFKMSQGQAAMRSSGSGAHVKAEEPCTGTMGGWVGVKPHTPYRIATRIRAVGGSADVHIAGKQVTLTATQDGEWTSQVQEFDSGWDDALRVECRFQSAAPQSTFEFGVLHVEAIGEPARPNSISLDDQKPAIEVSPYIYGQFIEHLGRCIQGGIWAEILDDRKFFWLPGSEPSPWRPDGPSTLVRTTDEGLVLTGSLIQQGLTLQAEHEYVGRIVFRGAPGAEVSLSIGTWSSTFTATSSEFSQFHFSFTAGDSSNDARVRIVADSEVVLRAISLMPADNVEGFRADVLAALRELDAPIYRWPGGNFVSGYDWRDGIGDRDFRPTRKNPAWMGIESNDMGTLEFLRFCELINTEPLIVVNTGFGDSNSAREWVEYVNGSTDTRWGRLRAEHGRPETGNVVWWGIGNEMYGPWQLGHMSIDHYVIKHRDFVDKMKRVDPNIKAVAVGELGFGGWSRRMLTDCASHMDHLSEHFYCGEKPGLMTHARQVPLAVKTKVDAHREFRRTIPQVAERDIRIALDEWNYWYGDHIFGELGTRYFWKDGIGIAMGLHEMLRNGDLFAMANYAQTVNVIGALKATPTAVGFETTGLVLRLYRRHMGTRVLPLSGDFRPLDVVAARRAEDGGLTLGIINATTQPMSLPLGSITANAGNVVDLHRIVAEPMEHNDPETPAQVGVEMQFGTTIGDAYVAPAASVTIVAFRDSGR